MKSNMISMVEAKLPPGFRFHPSDEELVCDYLLKKITLNHSSLLVEVDLNKCEPWDLPDTARVGSREWYFYSKRDRKYATGLRTNRATASGYWKATGKDRHVLGKGSSIRQTGQMVLVGMRKTLVFYQGRAPKGRKTQWVMHEFRLQGPLTPPQLSSLKEDWVLCRVFYKHREVGATRSSSSMMNSFYDETTTTTTSSASHQSKTMKNTMESNFITFDQTHQTHDQLLSSLDHHDHRHNNEQVPCFSMIFSQNQTHHPFNDDDDDDDDDGNVTHMMTPFATSLPNNTSPSPCNLDILQLQPLAHHQSNNNCLNGAPTNSICLGDQASFDEGNLFFS